MFSIKPVKNWSKSRVFIKNFKKPVFRYNEFNGKAGGVRLKLNFYTDFFLNFFNESDFMAHASLKHNMIGPLFLIWQPHNN